MRNASGLFLSSFGSNRLLIDRVVFQKCLLPKMASYKYDVKRIKRDLFRVRPDLLQNSFLLLFDVTIIGLQLRNDFWTLKLSCFSYFSMLASHLFHTYANFLKLHAKRPKNRNPTYSTCKGPKSRNPYDFTTLNAINLRKIGNNKGISLE